VRRRRRSASRSVYADPGFSTAVAAGRVLELVNEGAEEAKQRVVKELEWRDDLTEREADLRRRRTELGAQREGVLEALEELAAWYRDLICVAAGAENVVAHYDHLLQLTEDASPERLAGAERAVELVREIWRGFEELNLQPKLALESLFVQLRRELGAPATVPA